MRAAEKFRFLEEKNNITTQWFEIPMKFPVLNNPFCFEGFKWRSSYSQDPVLISN